MGSMIDFDRADGKGKARGYLANCARAGAPGVVVIQEWWGLQDQIKGICDRLAAAGYHALAPDLYNGVAVPYHDPDAANQQMTSLDFIDATDNAVRGAVQYFKKQGLKAGLTGFCMGGAVTIIGSVRIPELDAGVCFYGIPPAQAADPAQVRIPLQGHFASRDDWCTPRPPTLSRRRSRLPASRWSSTCTKLITVSSTSSVMRYTMRHAPSRLGIGCWPSGKTI